MTIGRIATGLSRGWRASIVLLVAGLIAPMRDVRGWGAGPDGGAPATMIDPPRGAVATSAAPSAGGERRVSYRRADATFGDDDLARLDDLPRLRALDLSLCAVTDRGLASLGGSTGLRALDLFGTRIGDDGLSRLGGLTDLRALYLECTAVSDAGLVHLGRLSKLETLALTGTRITDGGLDPLKTLANLRALDLSQTAVTDAGVEALRRALPGVEIRR